MDPSISWFQPEHEGPAKDFWLRIWENLKPTAMPPETDNKPEASKALDFIGLESDDTVKTTKNSTGNKEQHRARENIASTYGMNLHRELLIGKHGGTPWRVPGRRYLPGILGLVFFLQMSLHPTDKV